MKYIGNPVEVEAFKITSTGHIEADGSMHVATDDGENRIATKEMLARYIVEPGDYWVIQSDGYEYVNPSAVFERKYSPARNILQGFGVQGQ